MTEQKTTVTTVADVLALAGLENGLEDLAELEADRYHHTLYLRIRPSDPDAKGRVTWAAVDAHVFTSPNANSWQQTDPRETDDQLVALWSGGDSCGWTLDGDCQAWASDDPDLVDEPTHEQVEAAREAGKYQDCLACPHRTSSCNGWDDWRAEMRDALQEALDEALADTFVRRTGEVAQ